MANFNEEVKIEGVYGGYQTNTSGATTGQDLPVKRGFWSSMKAFWLQKIDWNAKIDWNREIKVELTPYQQKVEDEVNEFLHQDLTWDGFRKLLTGK